jgi:hypothetical protein
MALHESKCTIQNANQQQSQTIAEKCNQKRVHPHVIRLSQPPTPNTSVKVTLVSGPLLTPVALKMCR